MNNKKHKAAYELHWGLDGSGNTTWIVLSEWVDLDGRTRSHAEYFTTEAQAKNWIKWSC